MDRCGPYELLERVGDGSSGVVYRARKHDGPPTEVALKRLHSEPPKLWLEQMREVAKTRSPHLCDFLEAGDDQGQSYTVYRFLSGGDLETARCRYDEGRVPLRTALRWGIDVLEGLSALHRSGYLHGDIKPSNLMLDEQGRVVVCDFTTLTSLQGALATDLRNGTPEYLPGDESLLRAPQRDLHALGLTLVGLLVGQLPHGLERTLPSQFDPLLPEALDRIIARSLGIESPYATADEMRQDLSGLLGSPEPVAPSSNLSPPTRRVDWQTRSPKRPLWPWLVASLMLPLAVWLQSLVSTPAPSQVASTALWSGIGVAPDAYKERIVWQVTILGRPVLGFTASDPAAGDETAQQRAEWCAAVLEEAHFQQRPLSFSYRREFEQSCDVYLVGQGWEESFLFRVTPEESQLFERKGPFLARAWCSLIADTSELARPGARAGEKGAGSLLLQPWQRRFETLAGQPANRLEQPERVRLWLEALHSLSVQAHAELVDAYRELPEESGRDE